MKLTDTERQDIQKLDAEKCTDLLHECAERLGLMTVSEYCEMTREPRRTIYEKIKDSRISNVEFCGSKLIIMNYL